jgi:uncharacterized protein
MALGAVSVNYLLPDYNHQTIGAVRDRFGPTPCADFLLPILEDWWANGTLDTDIPLFTNMARVILGGASRLDMLGNRRLSFLFVETDGGIEGLDVLRVAYEGCSRTELNVHDAGFEDVARSGTLHCATVFAAPARPTACRSCPEADTCSGGYLPHRYAAQGGFDNPSVWCADLLMLFARMRKLLNVAVPETRLRRQVLGEMRVGPRAGIPA